MMGGGGSYVEVCVFPDASDYFFYFFVVYGEFLEVITQVGEVGVIVMLAGVVGDGGLTGMWWFSG